MNGGSSQTHLSSREPILDLTNLYSGYARASTYNPVDRKTLQRGLKRYKLNFDAGKGKSDTQIRKLAIQAVLKRKGRILPALPGSGYPRKSPSTDNF